MEGCCAPLQEAGTDSKDPTGAAGQLAKHPTLDETPASSAAGRETISEPEEWDSSAVEGASEPVESAEVRYTQALLGSKLCLQNIFAQFLRMLPMRCATARKWVQLL